MEHRKAQPGQFLRVRLSADRGSAGQLLAQTDTARAIGAGDALIAFMGKFVETKSGMAELARLRLPFDRQVKQEVPDTFARNRK
ncbi:MAG: hypothetical protein JO283_17550 [Bradyrhizobium sp.]|nr:hypothetical protein [Bradyrhizobium sp.]